MMKYLCLMVYMDNKNEETNNLKTIAHDIRYLPSFRWHLYVILLFFQLTPQNPTIFLNQPKVMKYTLFFKLD